MVEPSYHFAQCLLEKAEIDEHSALAQALTRCPSPHPVVMAVETLALAIVMNKPVRSGESSFNPNIVHTSDNIHSSQN